MLETPLSILLTSIKVQESVFHLSPFHQGVIHSFNTKYQEIGRFKIILFYDLTNVSQLHGAAFGQLHLLARKPINAIFFDCWLRTNKNHDRGCDLSTFP